MSDIFYLNGWATGWGIIHGAFQIIPVWNTGTADQYILCNFASIYEASKGVFHWSVGNLDNDDDVSVAVENEFQVKMISN